MLLDDIKKLINQDKKIVKHIWNSKVNFIIKRSDECKALMKGIADTTEDTEEINWVFINNNFYLR